MESCEQVFGNVNLLTLILEYLDFGDLLRFAQVNEQFRNAYEFCSGKINYSSLHIIHVDPMNSELDGKIVIANEMGINSRCLEDPQLLKDFLVVYADKVRDLTLWQVDESSYHAFPRKFPNLRSLSTYTTVFTRAIIDMCPADLQELNLIDCSTDANTIVEVLIRRTRNLNTLQIVDRNDDRDTGKLVKIDHLPKLKFLKFKMLESAANVCLSSARNLEELDIKLWNVECLKKLPLQNLKVLHLGLVKDTDQLFSILTESCAALETLTLKDVKFKNMSTCSLPPKVTLLSFLRCDGIAHSCLKQILTEFQIIKFRSISTQYTGEFHDFKISSHIQSLDVDFVQMSEFRSAYENNSQLKELIWRTGSTANDTYDVSFNSTPNLQLLEMGDIPVAGALSELTSLQSLILRPCYSQPEWNDIVDLLKHPTLHELSLHAYFRRVEKIVFTPLELRQLPVHTNITRLNLMLSCLETWMQYWLKLFSTNKQLTLVCLSIAGDGLDFAKELVNHENFPRELKTMDVCCFTIDCERLRRNFESVRREFIMLIISDDGCYDEDGVRVFASRNHIVLSWKKETMKI